MAHAQTMSASDSTLANRVESADCKAFVGRQAVYDRVLGVYAYELLYRSDESSHATFVDGEAATSEVILATFMDIGLERIVDQHYAFINFSHDAILSAASSLPLPADRVVLEILEDVEADAELVRAVEELKSRGFRIALDDFVYDDRWLPLVTRADIVKIDVRALSLEEVAEQLRWLEPHGVKLLAEKVETLEEYKALVELGFEYFQGFFLARPQVISGKRLPTSKIAMLEILAALQSPDATSASLADIISRDVALSYKLLRFINSAMFALPAKIVSIHRAIVFFGLDALRRWVSLMVMARADDKPPELIRLALVRAKMCELLCEASSEDAMGGFTAGLFSALDALMDTPLRELLQELPLAEDIKRALLHRSGPLGEALAATLAYEEGDWSATKVSGLSSKAVRDTYWRAVDWSREVSGALADR